MYKNNNIIYTVIKGIITVACLIYLYVIVFESINTIRISKSLIYSRFPTFILVLVLTYINWSLETLKWKKLVNNVEKISFKQSFKSTLLGVSSGLFTPNRTGDFIGKISTLKKSNRLKGGTLSIYGSFSQIVISISVGLLALSCLNIVPFYFRILLFTVSITTILIYLNVFKIGQKISKYTPRFLEKYKFQFTISSKAQIETLIFSLLRYMVFCTQLYLLLTVFDVSITKLNALIYIPLVYLSTTIIPSITLAELGIREISAVHILGLVSNNESGIIAATFILWVFNLLIPGIIGLLIFNLKSIPKK